MPRYTIKNVSRHSGTRTLRRMTAGRVQRTFKFGTYRVGPGRQIEVGEGEVLRALDTIVEGVRRGACEVVVGTRTMTVTELETLRPPEVVELEIEDVVEVVTPDEEISEEPTTSSEELVEDLGEENVVPVDIVVEDLEEITDAEPEIEIEKIEIPSRYELMKKDKKELMRFLNENDVAIPEKRTKRSLVDAIEANLR